MTTVERLEQEIRGLPPAELAAFRAWFREYDAKHWDEEIEVDAKAGSLDRLADAALREHQSGKTKRL